MNLKDAKNLGNLSTIFESKFSEKDCLIVDDKTLNFQEFSNLIISYSKKFKVLGLEKGDRIGILLFNSIEYLLKLSLVLNNFNQPGATIFFSEAVS